MDNEKAIQVFHFQDQRVRTIIMNGEIWFVIADACKVLEIANVGNAIRRLDRDGIRQADVTDSIGRSQQTAVANEPNLYRLIFRSDKEEAKAFQDWVYKDVLPAIRKTGSYSIPQQQAPRTISDAVRLRALMNERRVPDGFFAVLMECERELYHWEKILNERLDNESRVEHSVGRHWSTYARNVLKIPDQERNTYPHTLPDRSNPVYPWAYPLSYLTAFRYWLREIYFVEKFEAYARYRAKSIGAPIPQISTKTMLSSGTKQLHLF
jgi:prophage antirepressor-like protein